MGIAYDTATCRNLEHSLSLEWLRTNGLGGYASGTVSGANTRKYHGYLVVAAHPPVERYVVLSRVEDRAIIAGATYDLSTDEFPDTISPQGYKQLLSFELNAGAIWRYQLGETVIEKSVTLIHGQDTVVIKYQWISGPAESIKILVHPMLAGRDFHGTIQSHFRPGWSQSTQQDRPDMLMLVAPECPVKLSISHNADRFSANANWWYNFILRQERMRGYPDRDDLWTPGLLEFTLTPQKPVGLIASTTSVAWTQQEELLTRENTRYAKVATAFEHVRVEDHFLSMLSTAADQFVVHRGQAVANGHSPWTVIAGYPWFEDWGRDTFIALPGLTLVTGRHAEARSILVTFADHLQNGLLPNRFPDKAIAPEYNTVDASLWFVHAAYQYWRYSGDVKLLRDYLYRPLCEIIEKYRDGTDFGIKMDYDGLIRAGQRGVQLTWMDAKVGDWVVTPRYGKPVEINALWYNALRIMTLLATAANDTVRIKAFADLAALAESNFTNAYWNAEGGYLFDVIDDEGHKDGLVRPNQIFAVSLPFSPLSSELQARIVDRVGRDLLTPMGLRTLAPGSPGYHGRYAGDQMARDMAYHQGTAWPWLLGHYVSAFVKTRNRTEAARIEAYTLLKPLHDAMRTTGTGTICEIADADAPFTARGTIAQAWSVGEVLRAYWEDVLAKAPPWPHEKPAAPAAGRAEKVPVVAR